MAASHQSASGGPEQASEVLRSGGVIAYPTEAVFGLGCDPFNEAAVEKILTLKQRPRAKGVLLVAADQQQIAPLLAGLSPELRARLDESWPGPVTWLIPDPKNLYPAWIKGEHTSIAIRVSAHPGVKALCESFGQAIVSTSANLADEPEIRSRLTLQETFGDKVDFIVDGELGDSSQPSTIRDLLTGNTLR